MNNNSKYNNGGISSMMPVRMYQGGGINPFLDGYDYNDAYQDYLDRISGQDGNNVEDTISFGDALARGYGAPQDERIAEGTDPSKLNYGDTEPGVSISIDARDETPESYRYYPSEVSKLYAQMKGVPFSPLVAPPKEATYVDELGLYQKDDPKTPEDESVNLAPQKRITSQLYAKDGTYVNTYAEGTGEMGVEDYPQREELVTGPGGEKGDKIPAMLSDGEFIFNAAAVRGMGIMAGADPKDEYEQRLLGARQMYDYQKQAEEMAKRYA